MDINLHMQNLRHATEDPRLWALAQSLQVLAGIRNPTNIAPLYLHQAIVCKKLPELRKALIEQLEALNGTPGSS